MPLDDVKRRIARLTGGEPAPRAQVFHWGDRVVLVDEFESRKVIVGTTDVNAVHRAYADNDFVRRATEQFLAQLANLPDLSFSKGPDVILVEETIRVLSDPPTSARALWSESWPAHYAATKAVFSCNELLLTVLLDDSGLDAVLSQPADTTGVRGVTAQANDTEVSGWRGDVVSEEGFRRQVNSIAEYVRDHWSALALNARSQPT